MVLFYENATQNGNSTASAHKCPLPANIKTVQVRILQYAQEIGWTFVPRTEAEARRGFDPDGLTPEDRARTASLYFGDLLHGKVREFNPKYKEAEGALVGELLRQHQTAAVDNVVARSLDPQRSRGLVWHTQGSGKTYTMIKAAELLFKANEAQKPTILLMLGRNELEDQMLKNLASLGLANVAHANRIAELNRLLKEDYRGIIVTMIYELSYDPLRLGCSEFDPLG